MTEARDTRGAPAADSRRIVLSTFARSVKCSDVVVSPALSFLSLPVLVSAARAAAGALPDCGRAAAPPTAATAFV